MEDHAWHMKMKLFHYCFPILFCPFQFLFGQECSDRQATPETRALYKNLYILIGKNILFGHQDDPCYGVGWKYIPGRSDVKDITGQYPALYGFDLGRIELGLLIIWIVFHLKKHACSFGKHMIEVGLLH